MNAFSIVQRVLGHPYQFIPHSLWIIQIYVRFTNMSYGSKSFSTERWIYTIPISIQNFPLGFSSLPVKHVKIIWPNSHFAKLMHIFSWNSSIIQIHLLTHIFIFILYEIFWVIPSCSYGIQFSIHTFIFTIFNWTPIYHIPTEFHTTMLHFFLFIQFFRSYTTPFPTFDALVFT